MVSRLNRRDQFGHLRAHGTTVREGPFRISFVDPDATIGPCDAAVAFAVPRRYGSAVRRNLLRRRLRGIMRELADAGGLPERWYLVSIMGSAAEPRYEELSRLISKAVSRISELPDRACGGARSDDPTGSDSQP